MIIRKATLKDVDKVSEVLLDSGLGKSKENSKEMFIKEINKGDYYLLALENNKPIGIISWIFQGSYRHELAELYHIAVISEKIGTGIAKKLFEALIKDINEVYEKNNYKLRKLYVLTHADNKRAQAFYKKIGMNYEATLKNHFYKGKDEFVFTYYP